MRTEPMDDWHDAFSQFNAFKNLGCTDRWTKGIMSKLFIENFNVNQCAILKEFTTRICNVEIKAEILSKVGDNSIVRLMFF
jgi:hypothetical protein